MKQFIDDLISYISEHFTFDSSVQKTFQVRQGYDQKGINPPQICIIPSNDTVPYGGQTYDDELYSTINVQITIFTKQMKIDGIVYSAQDACQVIYEKLKNMLSINSIQNWNSNIIRCNRISGDFGLPCDDGATVYASTISYTFDVLKDYNN